MKKYTLFILFFFGWMCVQAQSRLENWKKMTPDARRDYLKTLSFQEKRTLFQDLKNETLLNKLDIPEDKKNQFYTLYLDYQTAQRNIKRQFAGQINADKLTDEQAKTKLNESFLVAQKLLDNRKEFAEKMQKIVPPQKVLQLFQEEGKMRGKMREKIKDRKPKKNP